MRKKLCVSLTGKTSTECLAFVESCEAPMIEHRLDFMSTIGDLDEIYSRTEKPIIATCRSIRDGGNFDGAESQRIASLLKALFAGASYVDIELDTSASLIEMVRVQIEEAGAQLIMSKHYYESTPPLAELTSALQAMQTQGANIAKIVTLATTLKDCERILQLYSSEQQVKIPLISFAMGEIGKFTRVLALFLGSPFMYVASDHGVPAAPGQISLSRMKQVLEVLE